MPVPATNYYLVPRVREVQHGLVFFPAPQSADFKRVYEHPELRHKIVQRTNVSLLTDARQVPHGVVQYDQNIRIFLQHFEELR